MPGGNFLGESIPSRKLACAIDLSGRTPRRIISFTCRMASSMSVLNYPMSSTAEQATALLFRGTVVAQLASEAAALATARRASRTL